MSPKMGAKKKKMAACVWLLMLTLASLKVSNEYYNQTEVNFSSFSSSVRYLQNNIALCWLQDGFCLSPRVLSFNWRNARFCLQLMILLCGDVHLNPGPEYPCSKCDLNVENDDKALCCDGCNQWIHVSCDQYISESIYDEMVNNPSSDQWFCALCVSSSIESNCINHLWCICLNARSLFPKRFSLLAFLSVVDADVIAITETFLDDTILSSQLLTSNYAIFRIDRNRHGGG